MDIKTCSVFLLILLPLITGFRKSSLEDHRDNYRGGIHYHSKRHMMTGNSDTKKRMTTLKPRELRKKPSGHLKPLDEDDMENDEVVSVAVGPPPSRSKFEKLQWKHGQKQPPKNVTTASPANNLVKEVLIQLGQEFMMRQISEDFVFGQYIGNSMRNLTADLKLKLQHEILELVVKYQKVNRGDLKVEDGKAFMRDKNATLDDNEAWPDFSNLAKIVGRR